MAFKKIIKVTPFVGTAKFCWLDKPNTKFVEDGEYSVDLVVPLTDAADLMDELQQEAKRVHTEAIAEAKKSGKKPKEIAAIEAYEISLPFEEETNDDNEKTGNVVLKFKNKAVIKPKGKPSFSKRISIVDAKRKPITGVKIGRGSKMKVAYEPFPFVAPGLKKFGVSLRLEAVQILELVEFGGNGGADMFGEEQGYEQPEETTGESIEGGETQAETTPASGGEDF